MQRRKVSCLLKKYRKYWKIWVASYYGWNCVTKRRLYQDLIQIQLIFSGLRSTFWPKTCYFTNADGTEFAHVIYACIHITVHPYQWVKFLCKQWWIYIYQLDQITEPIIWLNQKLLRSCDVRCPFAITLISVSYISDFPSQQNQTKL